MNYKYKLGFIGCGNMAKAIINGLLESKFLPKEQILISTPNIKEKYMGIDFVNDNSIILNSCEYVIIAVKPQMFRAILDTFANTKAKCLVSIMAGVNMATIQTASDCKEIIRIMPNTPCSIKEGVSAITYLGASKESVDFINDIFSTISKTVFVEEKYFDAVTSISGSGPAYVYYFIQSMIEAGVKGGLDYQKSKELTIKTMIGASKMVENSSEDINTLIEKVCSKGGTTIQAIDTFKEKQVSESIKLGIEKCRIRSEELSKA